MKESIRETKSSRVEKWLSEIGMVVAVAAAILGIWHWTSPRSSPLRYFLPVDALPAIPRPQPPQTLDPGLFAGQVAQGYRVAREQPHLLEQMPCYCGCYATDGHQNNLDCFRDRHGESCPMCLAIALRAEKLAKNGYFAKDIKKKIDRQFAPRVE